MKTFDFIWLITISILGTWKAMELTYSGTGWILRKIFDDRR